MTPGEPAISQAEDEPLDLAGFEAASKQPEPPAALTALYRLRAAALQMIAKENAREHAAAYERLRLDKELKQSTSFDWTRVNTAVGVVSAQETHDTPDPSRIETGFRDPKRVAWEDDETYFVWEATA